MTRPVSGMKIQRSQVKGIYRCVKCFKKDKKKGLHFLAGGLGGHGCEVVTSLMALWTVSVK